MRTLRPIREILNDFENSPTDLQLWYKSGKPNPPVLTGTGFENNPYNKTLSAHKFRKVKK